MAAANPARVSAKIATIGNAMSHTFGLCNTTSSQPLCVEKVVGHLMSSTFIGRCSGGALMRLGEMSDGLKKIPASFRVQRRPSNHSDQHLVRVFAVAVAFIA